MIDLHLHTIYSDGVDDLEKLIDKVKARGIKIFSITDHENFDGCKIINDKHLQKIKDLDLTFINGVEFDSALNGKNFHILAYDFDVNNPKMEEIKNTVYKLTQMSFNKRVKDLKINYNISLTAGDYEYLSKIENPNRIHLSKIIYNKGYTSSWQEAFNKYLYKENYDFILNTYDLIKMIKEAGAVAVWAHPLGGYKQKELEIKAFRNYLDKLVEVGLDGIECFYATYNNRQQKIICEEAKKRGLLLSAGSDYHGENKPEVKLGANGTERGSASIDEVSILKKFNIATMEPKEVSEK